LDFSCSLSQFPFHFLLLALPSYESNIIYIKTGNPKGGKMWQEKLELSFPLEEQKKAHMLVRNFTAASKSMASVLDFGKPSISDSIRSIKMYS
jgi:hypothetical protein